MTTKIHVLVDAMGIPVKLVLSEGQAYDGRSARMLLDNVKAGCMVLADWAYDADAIRTAVAQRGAWANIPPMPQRRFRPTFSNSLSKARRLIARFFNRIKLYRAIATRYEKRPENYLALVRLASLRIRMRFYESVTWRPSGVLSPNHLSLTAS